MSIFSSLKWFKSEKELELESLKVEEQKLKNELLQKDLKWDAKPLFDEPVKPKRPFSTVKLVNNVLTVVLNNGDVVSKTEATKADFEKVRDAVSENDVLFAVLDQNALKETLKVEKEIEQVKKTIEGMDILRGLSDFEVEGKSVTLKGTNRTIPPLLVEKFAEIIGKGVHFGLDKENLQFHLSNNEEYLALKRFFLWCCLNPRAEVADDLYDFLVRNSFRITKQGFFVALRNIVTVESGDKKLVEFVSNAYNKIKAVWKKNPDDYFVYSRLGDFKVLKKDANLPTDENPYWTFVGVLKDLYLDLPNMKENRYTDAHTKTFDIRVGKVVNMPPEECSWSTVDCAEAGLHFTSDEIHYVGCGDTSVLVLINPMKVVGIGASKGRCYEYLPIMTVPRDEATTILHDLDFDTLELDEDFAIQELENLTDKVKEGFAKEAKKYEFNIPSLSTFQVEKIVASLEEMKDTLNKRVVNV